MHYTFRLLRSLGEKIAKREINDEGAVQLAEALDAALAEAIDAKSDELKEDARKAVEEKIDAALKGNLEATEAAKKEVEDIAEEARKALAEIEKRNSVRHEVRRQLRSMLDANKDQIREAYHGGQPFELKFAMRDAALMTTANFAFTLGTGAGAAKLAPGTVISDEIHEIRYPENFIIDAIGGRQVSLVRNLVERGVATEEGAAVVVPEGGLKPMISWTTKTVTYLKRKIAGHIEYTDELKEAEGERLYNLILDLLERKVLRDYQKLTMDWLEANASVYLGQNALSDSMVIPTNNAAYEAAALQLQALGYAPDVLYINPADEAADKYMQTESGSFINVNRPDMLPLKVYRSYAVPKGKFFVLDSAYIREEHTDVTLKFGRINDQLIKNEETCVAELYQLLHFVNGENVSAIYGDLATIKADLQKIAEEPAEPEKPAQAA